MRLVIGFVLGIVIGVAIGFFVIPICFPTPSPRSNAFGRFIGTLNPTWLDDGRTMKLNSDFAFIGPDDRGWVAPAGSVIDGASIPPTLWTIVGGPYEGPYRNASVVHDVACGEKKRPSDEVHRMFYYACRCGGVEEPKAKAMYWAVLKYGPKWNIDQSYSPANDEPKATSRPVNIVATQDISSENLKAVLAFVESKDPDLDQIASVEIANGNVRIAAPP